MRTGMPASLFEFAKLFYKRLPNPKFDQGVILSEANNLVFLIG